MAKRREAHDEELPFVALMDTMTNVVGVLIIVLVMIGISLAQAVRKVLSDLPPVTKEQLEELKKVVVKDTPKEDPKKLEEEMKETQQALKKATEELKTMDLSTTKDSAKHMDLDELRKQLEERKKVRDTSKEDVDKLLAELDRLKKAIDTTPRYVPPPATVVKLPNPREIPENATVQRFIVTGGKVYYLNDIEFMKYIVQEIEKNQKSLVFGEVPVKDTFGNPVMEKVRGKDVPKMKTVFDQKKIVQHFVNLRLPVRDLKVELVEAPNAPRMPMRLTPNPQGGESVEQFKNPASTYQRAVRKFKSEPNTVMWFYVFKDSVEAFLAARDYADTEGVPVVWELYGNPYYQRNVAEYEVNFTPPKPQPPPPPGAVKIAAPKMTAD
ncbi:hypothetical protein [Verrucomicrobium sp. BvORR106]|uniref:hypothetical protein n=1 Tax=Verrucomicrobium sp. BvORR106 TaxID=1403819 RepID=UPI00056ED424|nr:hypothetical protein [Verrucomicrobium sp. BvORR106]